ncbi:MAG: helix-turn-helix transcriptional regulator [Synergistaceae bacterium]|nr:helix-turn-helix transcriptional regulator [Synergistaceae bacterium]
MPDNEAVCPLKYLSKTFGGKWKLSIICVLASKNSQRYTTIKRRLRTITNTMLAQSLRELEADGIINRQEFFEKLPHVEYSLTERGERALPMLTAAAEWAIKEMAFENVNVNCTKCQSI